MADFRFFRAMGKEKIPSSVLTFGWEKGLITKPLNFIHPSIKGEFRALRAREEPLKHITDPQIKVSQPRSGRE